MLIIGIAGGTGSGKTTVVNQILNELPADEVCVISQDSYYSATDNLSYTERTKINLGDDEAIYKISILKEFQNTIQDKRSLDDYSYIDLKINNQIIVRERNRIREKL